MMQTVSNPKLFIVRGKNEGIRVTLTFDTCREVGRSNIVKCNTKRHVIRKDINKFDTARLVHNMNNICFDTCRKICADIETVHDTFRRVKSKLPVYDYSFYVHSSTGQPIECVIFHHTDLFPLKDKYIHVKLDGTNEDGYLPLAPVGSEYDSGLRYTADDGTVWQICTNLVYNIIDEYFVRDNYFINTLSLDYMYHAFSAIFAGRVTRGSNCIYLVTPQFECGITKMLMIGIDLRISWTDDGTDNYNKGITLSTYNNGVNDTSYGGDAKYKANAMLVKFEPRRKYKIEFHNSHKTSSYNDEERIRGCFIFGRDIEKLAEESSTYESIINGNYCTCDEITYTVASASEYTDTYYYDTQELKDKILNYPHSTKQYQYYELAHIKYEDLTDG